MFRWDNVRDDSHYRIVVDEQEDFDVVKMIIEYFSAAQGMGVGFEKIKQYLDGHPDIRQRNSWIIRNEGLLKSLENDGGIVR